MKLFHFVWKTGLFYRPHPMYTTYQNQTNKTFHILGRIFSPDLDPNRDQPRFQISEVGRFTHVTRDSDTGCKA
jgi:hypothetical protein